MLFCPVYDKVEIWRAINAVLKNIKESIDKIRASADSVLKKFEAIDESVKIVAAKEDNIRYSVEAQGHDGRRVLETIYTLAGLTDRVKGIVEGMLADSGDVVTESKTLKDETAEITNGPSL